ncbi:MAG: hypothetical protein PHQ60_11795 [Sideroxydans sp.]|nr:hypothetical protein [Sideroxydans sp.]
MTYFDNLAFTFLAAGITLIGAAGYLSRLSNQYRTTLAALLKSINPRLDPLQLPAAAWPALSQGGIAQLTCTGKWFGQPINVVLGSPTQHKPHTLNFLIEVEDDIHLEFRLYTKSSRGEAKLFAEHLCDVFQLQMEAAVQVKMSALAAAMSEQARLTLYLQHDLRNLAQWVTWLADDFPSNQNDAKLLNAAKRIAVSVPHASARAKRILAATRRVKPKHLQQMIGLANVMRQTAELAGIPIQLSGDACVYLRLDLLERALDNLFTNVAPLLRAQPDVSLPISITQEQHCAIARIVMPQLAETPILLPEKLFEPFSSGRVGGLGLGLYQARKSLHEAEGDLTAAPCAQGIEYTLTLPVPDDYA